MAWEAAGYAAALAFLAAAGLITFAAFRIGRLLGRLEQTADQLAKKADSALDAYTQLAHQSQEAAAAAGRLAQGFAKLGEGAGSVGEAAQSAAHAAAQLVSAWRDRFVRSPEEERASSGGQLQEIAELIGQLLAMCLKGHSQRRPCPGENADQRSGE
jgi:ABC-type transporter Mla subunit MlaD